MGRLAGDRLARRLALPLLLLLLPGCRLIFERERVGQREPVWQATHLEMGKSTLAETLARLGSPSLILKRGKWTRVYYTYWDNDFFRLIIRGAVPVGGGLRQVDALNMALGEESLELARLDFDERGVLALPPQVGVMPLSGAAYYVAIDSRLVSMFLEDRARALYVSEEEEDEEEAQEEEAEEEER